MNIKVNSDNKINKVNNKVNTGDNKVNDRFNYLVDIPIEEDFNDYGDFLQELSDHLFGPEEE